MAWLPSHQELRDHPKTRKLTVILGVPRAQVIGHLHCLWWWALTYTPDGNLDNYDDTDVALGAEWEGDPAVFIAALQTCGSAGRDGFLDRTGKRLHNWDKYGGKYVEKRRKDAARKRDGGGVSHFSPADTQPTSDGVPVEGARKSRVEERREENTPSLALVATFEDFYAAYPKRVDRRAAEKAWRAAMKRGADPTVIIDAAKAYATDRSRKPEFTKNPSTWLNAAAYENELAATGTTRPPGYDPHQNWWDA